MADHRMGSMDIRAHERTFSGFLRVVSVGAVVIVVFLVFLALANG